MIEKEFVPYELAVKLKELGFDEPCFGCFNHLDKSEIWTNRTYMNGLTENITAPTFSQAFRWFREKYEYNSFIKGRKSMGFDYTLSDVPTNLSKKDIFQSPHVYETYEEAELACLRKLIEIVKNQSN